MVRLTSSGAGRGCHQSEWQSRKRQGKGRKLPGRCLWKGRSLRMAHPPAWPSAECHPAWPSSAHSPSHSNSTAASVRKRKRGSFSRGLPGTQQIAGDRDALPLRMAEQPDVMNLSPHRQANLTWREAEKTRRWRGHASRCKRRGDTWGRRKGEKVRGERGGRDETAILGAAK